MLIKTIRDEDFCNFKSSSMFIGLGTCDWKCCKEANIPIEVCQNSELACCNNIDISADEIFRRYIYNSMTSAVVIGGLEPITQINDVYDLIQCFRDNKCNDPFVIYTGYNICEISDIVNHFRKHFTNIILKTGRYIPNQQPHYDEILGVNLASDNQKGVQIC